MSSDSQKKQQDVTPVSKQRIRYKVRDPKTGQIIRTF